MAAPRSLRSLAMKERHRFHNGDRGIFLHRRKQTLLIPNLPYIRPHNSVMVDGPRITVIFSCKFGQGYGAAQERAPVFGRQLR
jgi:hypothetical protein